MTEIVPIVVAAAALIAASLSAYSACSALKAGDRAAHLCTPKARAKLRASKYWKVMATLSQIELEAKKSQDHRTAQIFRTIIDKLKNAARTIKKTAGEDGFRQWAEWLYSQCPFSENNGSLAQ